MKLLTAVNTVLAYIGEHKVTSIDSQHSTVDNIRDAIDRQRVLLLHQSWWFNDYERSLLPDIDGIVRVPKHTLNLYGLDNTRLDVRGGKLIDTSTGVQEFSSPQRVQIVEDVQFEDLPDVVGMYCTYSAAIEIYTQEFGVENTIQVLQSQAGEAYGRIVQENLRKYNFNSVRNTRKRYNYTGGYR